MCPAFHFAGTPEDSSTIRDSQPVVQPGTIQNFWPPHFIDMRAYENTPATAKLAIEEK